MKANRLHPQDGCIRVSHPKEGESILLPRRVQTCQGRSPGPPPIFNVGLRSPTVALQLASRAQ